MRSAFLLAAFPMDSVRYFEFDFMWRALSGITLESYLDVSSPRLLPLAVISQNPGLVADLLNPAKDDLPATISLATSLGLAGRCRFHDVLIQDAPLGLRLFDAITCISVLEHIPDDKSAIERMWSLVKPGGRLLISVPCAAKAFEEYIDVDEYGLLEKDGNGFVYWQRYYDEALMRQQIFSVTGEPDRLEIYGEKRAGSYDENVDNKRRDPMYPFWKEPFMMGVEYQYMKGFSDLPGVGVVAMEFVKR